MTKTSLSVGLLFTLGLVAFSSACSSSTPPVPIGSGGTAGPAGGGVGTGGGDTGAGGSASLLTNPILFNGSWTPADQNTVGIQGSFFILEDSVKDGALLPPDGLVHSDFDDASAPTAEIDFSKFSDTTPEPCISGNAAKVENLADPAAEKPYSEIWGGGIGMKLNETGGEDSVASPFDAVAAGIGGFEFQVSGDVTAATVRFKATQMGSTADFCKAITVVPGQVVKVMFSELEHECWSPNTDKTLDLTQLEAIQWQIVTDDKTAHKVTNFCVKSLGWVAP